MPENEFYRQTIVIDVQGDVAAKTKLKAMDNYLASNQKKAKALDKTRVSPKLTLADRISKPLANIQTKLKKLGGIHKVTIAAVDKTKNVLSKITRAITSPLAMLGAGTGVAAAFGYSMKLAGDMEQANIAMETMLGNRTKALAFQKELTNFAIKTPFEMPQLREATTKLLAFGFAADKIIPTLTAIGDASSGLGIGAEGIDRISIALGQMKAKAKVSADEMLQLTEAGVPAWDILAKKMGKSTAEVMKMSEKGLIPANKAIDMMLSGMEERFPNMMAKQSRTLFGLTSTLKDFLNLKLFTAFGEGMRRSMVPAMQKMVDMLDKNADKVNRIEKLFLNLGQTVGKKLVDGFDRAYKWFEKLSGNQAFRKLDFTGKLAYMLDKGIAELTPIALKAGTLLGLALAKGITAGVWQAAAEDPQTGATIGLLIPGPWQAKVGAAAGLSLIPWAIKRGKERIKEINEANKMRGWSDAFIDFKEKAKNTPAGEPLIKGATISAHAAGGIFNKPHIGLLAEEDREAAIPLAPKRRKRALSLWAQVGHQLGIPSFANGGIIGQPALAGAGSVTLQITIPGVKVFFNNQTNKNEIANQIGWEIIRGIEKALENRV